MIINPKHLLLIRCEFSCRPLEAQNLSFSTQPYASRVAMNKSRTFKARRIACVLDRSPMAAEPCLTASRAYSTWCSRPCGEKMVLSESYVLRNCIYTDSQYQS